MLSISVGDLVNLMEATIQYFEDAKDLEERVRNEAFNSAKKYKLEKQWFKSEKRATSWAWYNLDRFKPECIDDKFWQAYLGCDFKRAFNIAKHILKQYQGCSVDPVVIINFTHGWDTTTITAALKYKASKVYE